MESMAMKNLYSSPTSLATFNLSVLITQSPIFLPISIGVPWCSLLGPLPFLMFINDIVYSSPGHLTLSADDTGLMFHTDFTDQFIFIPNHGLMSVSNRVRSNKLTIYPSKFLFYWIAIIAWIPKTPTACSNWMEYSSSIDINLN